MVLWPIVAKNRNRADDDIASQSGDADEALPGDPNVAAQAVVAMKPTLPMHGVHQGEIDMESKGLEMLRDALIIQNEIMAPAQED